MDDYGSVIDVNEIIISDDDDCQESTGKVFGSVITMEQVKTYRRKKKTPLFITDSQWYALRDRRAKNGRKYGEEYDFELTDAQEARLKRWKEIYDKEIEEDKAKFDRRMKRLQATHGRL